MAVSEELLRIKLLDAKKAEAELRGVRRELEYTTGSTAKHAAADDEAAASAGRLKGAFSGLKNVLLTGGSLIGIAGVGYGLKDLVQSGQKAQEQTLLLKNALKATGQEGAGHIGLINKAITQSGATGGFSKLEETQGIAELVRETKSATAAVKDNASAVTLARGAHESYASALSQVEKVQTGSVGRLQKLVGPFVATKYYVDQLTASEKARFPQKVKEAELLDKEATAREFNRRILERYGSSVNAYNKSTAGSISNANNAFKNVTEQLGEKLLPAEKAVAQWFGKTVVEISKGEGIWKTVGRDIEGVWHSLEKVWKFLDQHKDLAKILGYGAAVGAGTALLKKAPGAGVLTKILTAGGPAGEGAEGGFAGVAGIAAAPWALGATAATAYGLDVYKTRNELGAHAQGALAMLGGRASTLSQIEQALFGYGNTPLRTRAGGRAAAAGESAGEAQLVSKFIEHLSPSVILHIDSVKVAEAELHNPRARRQLAEAVTKYTQERRARE